MAGQAEAWKGSLSEIRSCMQLDAGLGHRFTSTYCFWSLLQYQRAPTLEILNTLAGGGRRRSL